MNSTRGEQITLPIGAVVVPEWNPRTALDADGRKFIATSYDLFGNVELMVYNRTTGHLISGAKRLEVLRQKGEAEISVWAVDLSEDDEKLASVALNNHVGEFDAPRVDAILQQAAKSGNVGELLSVLRDKPKAKPVTSSDPAEAYSFVIPTAQFDAFRAKIDDVCKKHALPGEAPGDTILRILSDS